MSTPAHQEPAVQLEHVSQVFGSFAALRDVSLEIAAGSSVVLLGENGAGKSTLLRLLAGLASPTYGKVRVWGRIPRDVSGSLAYAGHASMLYDELTASENLLYFGRLGGVTASGVSKPGALAVQVARALDAVGLDPENPRRVEEYSQGMRQRASLARVLLSEPDLLLLDEPFANLDAASAKAMIACLQSFLAQRGTSGRRRTLVLTTHQPELAQPLAQSTLVLQAGRVAGTGGSVAGSLPSRAQHASASEVAVP